jgi:hypothetical protein
MPVRRNLAELTQAEQSTQKAAAAKAQTQKELETANAAVKAAAPDNAPALQAAQAQVKAATAKLAETTQTHAAAEKAAKDLAAKNPPKDATFVVYSNPIRLLVKEAPKK